MSLDELIDEMIEFGIPLANALHVAPSLLPLCNDPEGRVAMALSEAAPKLAKRMGQQHKPATAITRLARRARIPAYLVLYQRSTQPNPADPRMVDVSGFRIKRLYPRAETAWRTVPPAEWASALLRIRAWAAKRLDMQAANDPNW